MHSLQKQFHDFINTHQMTGKNEKVLLAVSGGLDSMAMCNLFLKAKIAFAIAHCNFRLRGDESDGDEAFVMEWAHHHDINCFVKSFDLGEGSIQLEARKARYEWFQELVVEHGFDKVATAHHLNDSLETLLINLSRGTGFKGITGVPVISENVIRPLLFASKRELTAYAIEEKIEWREDSSNEKDTYDRNHVRHHIVPELEKLNASLLKSFSSTNERLRYGAQIISEKVNEMRAKHLFEEKAGGFRLSLGWMKAAADLVILAEILSDFGVNYATSKEIHSSLGKSGKSFPAGEWFITMDRDSLFIDGEESPSIEIRVNEIGTYAMGISRLTFKFTEKESIVFGSDDEAFFDYGRLKFPLTIRTWREGDRFQPLGMKQSKKVSDLLIDLKIPLAKKKQIYVLECDREIAWVIGYRISEKFKISDGTQKVLKVSKNMG